ncbi:LysR family transcriptional regulator [Clostridium sardiniense]|uniref:LysR family transcriptional regulator n=1 Tax=Clostridium sardiniense TaxID=29369 RepID=UPI003D32988B
MDIKHLKYFIAIAEEGNITSAAKRLHISQPPLSMQLKLLEEELGMTLVERGSRNITLTDAGRLLYKHACKIVSLTTTAIKEIEDFDNGVKGTLRLGTISSSGTALLSHRMIEFHKDNPNISFEVHEGTTFEMLDMLEDNTIEVAMVRTPFKAKNVAFHYLESEPMVAVAREEHFSDIKEDIISIDKLDNKPLIFYRRYESLLTSAFEKNNVKLNSFCKNDDARTTLLWAKAGLGIAVIPKSAAKIIEDNNLKTKVIDETNLYTRLGVIYRKSTNLSKAAKSFIKLFN